MILLPTHSIPTHSIIVAPDRQRKELRGIEELAQSIIKTGLLHPIIITPDGQLVAGERRLRAHLFAGLSHIPARYTTELPTDELERIELEENVKRNDLTWREENAAIARYHALRESTEESWTLDDTAQALSYSKASISRHLGVAAAIASGDELVMNADTLTVAVNIVARRQQRAADASEVESDASITDFLSSPANPAAVASAPATAKGATAVPRAPEGEALSAPKAPFLHADFHEWLKRPFAGPKFNFIHCDFPYGINFDKHNGGATGTFGGYDDSGEVYWGLIKALASCMDSHVAKSAHLMFWLSPKYLEETAIALEKMGWKVNYVPLIWHRSDNSGILPDPKRGPRQVYETCLMASRGDRFVAQAVSNLFACPKSKEIHASEKPREMLAHFFRMFVDESTVMLDPTMGSGNSVRVAQDMGAKRVLGLERDQTFYENACLAYAKAQL